MIKAEWAYMQRHKFMMIVMAIIMLIPSIYAVTFLRSMWDPYGRLNHLPVAVVNQDQAVTYQGHRLSIGHDLTHTLKQSDALEFHAMTADQAQTGLKMAATTWSSRFLKTSRSTPRPCSIGTHKRWCCTMTRALAITLSPAKWQLPRSAQFGHPLRKRLRLAMPRQCLQLSSN